MNPSHSERKNQPEMETVPEPSAATAVHPGKCFTFSFNKVISYPYAAHTLPIPSSAKRGPLLAKVDQLDPRNFTPGATSLTSNGASSSVSSNAHALSNQSGMIQYLSEPRVEEDAGSLHDSANEWFAGETLPPDYSQVARNRNRDGRGIPRQ